MTVCLVEQVLSVCSTQHKMSLHRFEIVPEMLVLEISSLGKRPPILLLNCVFPERGNILGYDYCSHTKITAEHVWNEEASSGGILGLG